MARYQRHPDVLWREEDEPRQQALAALEQGEDAADLGTAILFRDGTMLSLNLLGAEVWKLCDGRSAEEIVATLLPQFEVSEAELAADVADFLAELTAKGFVTHAA